MVSPRISAEPQPWPFRRLLIGLVLVVALGMTVIRVRRTPFQWRLLLETLYHLDWRWLSLSMFLILLTYVGRALRWQVMLRPLQAKVSIRRLTYDTIIGFTAAVLLGRVGELVRPYLISVSASVTFSSQVAAWALERLLDMLVVLLLFGFTLLRIPSAGLAVGPHVRWVLSVGGYIVAILGGVCLGILVLLRYFSDFTHTRLLDALRFLPSQSYKRVESVLLALAGGSESIQKTGLLVQLSAYTVAVWGLILASYYVLFASFRGTRHLSLADVIITLGFMSFGSMVQIPGIGGGVQVACIVCLTEVFGYSLEVATGIALLVWFLTLVEVVPFGLFCAIHEGWNWRKIRQVSLQPLGEESAP